MNQNPEDTSADLPLSLSEKIASLPTRPGVYLHKNAEGTIIYVGKAKNIRQRVRQYFDQNRIADAKTRVLVSKIADIDVIVTDSEAEALLLENNLIKEHKPRYNILLKDDKTYPSIRITNEPYPRVFATRKIIRDGSTYFGPYTDLRYMYSLLRTLRSIFPLRSCDLPLRDDLIAQGKFKVCLDYHIKKCEGPCQAFVDRQHYSTHIKHCVNILNGKSREVEKHLEQQMIVHAEQLEFEEAARVRNRLEVLRDYAGKQKVMTTDSIDRDVVALARDDHHACTIVLTIRDGKLLGKRHYIVANVLHQDDSEITERALSRFYLENDTIPPEIFLPCELDNSEILLDWLQKKRGGTVEFVVPKIGDKKKLVAMAAANADFLLKELHIQNMKREEAVPRAVASLQRDLYLPRAPRRIECFDNSHLQGSDYVSSMVVFVDGKPRKSDYRKFKIASFVGNDDFAAMREVVRRRYTRLLAEKAQLPDLIIIDGGKGQLSAACEVLHELNLMESVPVIGLAKRLEEVFRPEISDPVLLPRTSGSLRLLQQLRDEAHRFAIRFHRELRSKRTLQTELTKIEGVGEKKAIKLLTELGSVQAVRAATREQIEAVVGKSTASKVLAFFNEQNDVQEDLQDEVQEDLQEDIGDELQDDVQDDIQDDVQEESQDDFHEDGQDESQDDIKD
ncbi:MAG: excinuclease ABC subunit UvrC [Candidatus Kapaibacterium sp.]